MTPVGLRRPPPMTPICFRIDIEERLEALDPLGEQLAAMDQERAYCAPARR